MSRRVPRKIHRADQGDLDHTVTVQLERDALIFVEEPWKKMFTRRMVEGETHPYALPLEATTVAVTRNFRTFMVLGIPELVIENEAKEKKPQPKVHLAYNFKTSRHEQPQLTVTEVDRDARRALEFERQQRHREEKRVKREQIMQTKRGE